LAKQKEFTDKIKAEKDKEKDQPTPTKITEAQAESTLTQATGGVKPAAGKAKT